MQETLESSVKTREGHSKQIAHTKTIILKYFKDNPELLLTAKDISVALGINSVIVNCRISEYLREGIIHSCGTTKRGRSTYTIFTLTDPDAVEYHKEKVLRQDYIKWVKKSEHFVSLMSFTTKLCMKHELKKVNQK